MAGYAKELLKGISDDKPLGAHLGKESFHALYEAYQKLANNDDSVPLITEEQTGWDFKKAMDELPPQRQVSLYYPYLRASLPQFEEEENPLEVKSRIKLREWYIRLIGYTCLTAVALLVGAAVTIGVKSGKAPSSEFIETFLSGATEVASMMFEGSHH